MDAAEVPLLTCRVRPTDLQQIGNELAIKWDDGQESFIALEKLRRACPCAGCKGETDVMGNLYISPPKPLRPESFLLNGVAHVGGYAIQPQWADGHSTGLYSFPMLRELANDSPSAS
jgi:DUF971 family protein